MQMLRYHSGLTLTIPSPPLGASEPNDVTTEEAGIRPPSGHTPRVQTLVKKGELVAQGAPVARLRDAPDVRFVAPMPGRVARITLLPGRRLSEIVLFREAGGDVIGHDATDTNTENGLRRLMQNAGFWPLLRRRPFGGMPDAAERPTGVVVMATDTRPHAPDPRRAIKGREEAFSRGLNALATLTDGPVVVCQQPGPRLFDHGLGGGRVVSFDCGPRHPQGSAGVRIHDMLPAGIEAPVWDVHGEDVATLGELLETGRMTMMRHVRVAGAALREGRLVRTQPGADLRELTRRVVMPGAHVLMSGSPLDGHQAHWLAPRDRQVTVLPRQDAGQGRHWLVTALTRSAWPKPVIPTAALTQALGAALPAATFVRALASGDDELAMKLGVLSFLEEDLALVDYVLGGQMHLTGMLRGMLDRIKTEFAA